MSTTVGAGIPDGGYQSPAGRTAGLPDRRRSREALVPPRRPGAVAVRAVEHHERVRLGLVRLLLLRVRQADHLVPAVAVEVGDRRRRVRPLQPHRLLDVGPRARVLVVVARFHRRVEPADELAPAEPPPCVFAVAIAEPRRCEHRGAVGVEDVDLVVVEGDHDLELRIVVEVADADVLAVGAVAVVADAVEVGVVALAAQAVVSRPCRRRSALRPVERASRVEDEHLRAGRRCVRRRHDDLDPAVSVEIGRRESPRLGALTAAARRGRPPRLELEATAAELVGRHRALVAADDDLRPPVAVEVRHCAGGVDPPFRRGGLAELAPLRVEDERRVQGRDDLEPAVAVQVDEPG